MAGQELEFVERRPGDWFFVLGAYWGSAAWDWREDAMAYGPFGSEQEARECQVHDHPGPSGSRVLTHDRYRQDEFHEDKLYVRLFEEALARSAPSRAP